MNRKVLFVASSFSHIRNFHLPYIKAFYERGWQVDVACGGDKCEIPCSDTLFSLPFEKKMSSPMNFKAALILRREIKSNAYALICTNTALASFFVRLALTGMRRRPYLINMVHGYLFDDRTKPLRRTILLMAEKITAPVTDLLLTMNRYDYALAKRCSLGKKISLIPGVGVDYAAFDEQRKNCGRDIRRELRISDEAFVLIYAAEFSERKSQMLLIEAMTRLPNTVKLILAGEGSTRGSCMAAARKLGLSERVFFPGHVRPIGAWFDAADAVVSSSRSEGLPFNIMEAMHVGLPIIASDVKGNSDLIENGKNGLLYSYGDSHGFTLGVLRILGSEDLRSQLGRQAMVDADRYALEKVFPQVWQLLEEAAEQSLCEE